MALDYARRDFLGQLRNNARRDCHYYARWRPFIVTLLPLLLTAPEVAAVVAGYEALDIACRILESIPDPRPE